MMILGLASIPVLVILNMAFYEYRVLKPTKEDDIISKYVKLELYRRYK